MHFPNIFREMFISEVTKLGGGMVNCHAHLDRAFTVTPEIWEQAMVLMEEKWIVMREVKKNYIKDTEALALRMSNVIEDMMENGITACRTHVDADSIVGMTVVETAVKVREKFRGRFVLQLVAHPLEGFLNESLTGHDPMRVELFEKACVLCDVVGGLPSRDRKLENGDLKHMDVLFSIAKNLGKDLDVHIDQENNPLERDSEKLIQKTLEYGYQGKITFVHAISIACQSDVDRRNIIAGLKDIGANVSTCPRAAIGMTQHKDKMAPVHNSITPVDELLAAGVNVSIGIDNIADVFIPNSYTDLFDEVNLLADAVREYRPDVLAKIATVNGRKTMKLDV